MADNKIEKRTEQPAVVHQVQPVTPMDLIAKAQNDGADIEKMQQLFELKLRVDADNALRDYNMAVAKFKTENTKIYKDSVVNFSTSKGRTSYSHATLSNVVNTVTPLLAKYGLNHSWSTKQEGGSITVKCKLSHAAGHSESVLLFGQPDTSGTKNSVQAIGSTVTYLQRYTLMMILGLASGDADDDGQASNAPPVEYITESQAAEMQALMDEVKAKEAGFFAAMHCKSLATMPATTYKRAIAALEKKRDAQ